jgi:hypothetical protein
MGWFHEDHRRLTGSLPMRFGSSGDEQINDDRLNRTIAIGELNSSYAVHSASAIGTVGGTASWRRFMEHVFAGFRERRGPFGHTGVGRKGDDEADDDVEQMSTPIPEDPAIKRSFDIFAKLFDLLLSPQNAPRYSIIAFDLTQYICERLQPDLPIAKAWLKRLIKEIIRYGVPTDRKDDIAAAILVLLACEYEPSRARAARARLLRLGYSLSDDAPSGENVQGFQSVLIQTADFRDIWEQIKTVRTYPEQTRAYLSALKAGMTSAEYGDLPKIVPEEWPVLHDAFRSDHSRRRIEVLNGWSDSCPRCHKTLPRLEISKLRSIGLATAKNCCQRILFYLGD